MKNKSVVGEDGNKRDYSKPWLVNAGKKKTEEDKKSFLKNCYPDGNGPDTDLINLLEREVVDLCPNITFDDIAELQKAKDVL
jgi:katanin p60 ATPase-containing subunit A1